MRKDLEMWKTFITSPLVYSRPFLDFDTYVDAEEIGWYTDAAKAVNLGCGGVCGAEWFQIIWPKTLIPDLNLSIAYLELYAVAVSILHWAKAYPNRRLVLNCDNMSVIYMINKSTSHCKRCMGLIRIVVLECLRQNVKLVATHVPTKRNTRADLLSSNKKREFLELTGDTYKGENLGIPDCLWPVERIYNDV